MTLLADERAFKPLADLIRGGKCNCLSVPELLSAIVGCGRERGVHFVVKGMTSVKWDPIERFYAESVLTKTKGPVVRAAVLPLLKTNDDEVVDRAIRIVGSCAEIRDIPTITKLLHAGSDHRLACMVALGRMRNDMVVQDLVRYLDDYEEPDKVRATAARSLGLIGAARATIPLAKSLKNEEGLEVRLEIIRALGLIGDKRCVATLVRLLVDRDKLADPLRSSNNSTFPRNTEVRYAALWALQRCRAGKAKFDLLTRFRRSDDWPKIASDAVFAAWAQWWREHRLDVAYRF